MTVLEDPEDQDNDDDDDDEADDSDPGSKCKDFQGAPPLSGASAHSRGPGWTNLVRVAIFRI